MKRTLQRTGYSTTIAIPIAFLETLNLSKGDEVDVKMTTDGKLTIEKILK